MAFNPDVWEAVLAGSVPTAVPEPGPGESVFDAWARVTSAGLEAPAPSEEVPEATPLFQVQGGAGAGRPKGRPKKGSAGVEPLATGPAPTRILKRPASQQLAVLEPEPSDLAAIVAPDNPKPDFQGPLFQPAKKGRICPSTDLMVVLPRAQAHAAATNAPSDLATLKVADYFGEPHRYHLASNVVLEQVLGVDAAAIESRLERLAAALWVQQVYDRLLLEERMASTLPPSCLIFYLDFSAYDETPMKITLKERLSTSSSSKGAPADNLFPQAPVMEAPEQGQGQVVISKLLQTRGTFGMVVRTVHGLLGILSDFPMPLQSMQRNTGNCLSECLVQQSGVSHAADRWGLKLRAALADKAPSNRLAETLVGQARGPTWISSLFGCDVHAVAGCHAKVFEGLFPQDIAGMLRCSLSLRFHASWTAFRTALFTEINSRPLRVHRGRPPLENKQFQRAALDIFLPKTSKDTELTAHLLSIFNGDWRQSTLEYYLEDSSLPMPTEEEVKQKMQKVLLATLVRSRPHIWPRSRCVELCEAQVRENQAI